MTDNNNNNIKNSSTKKHINEESGRFSYLYIRFLLIIYNSYQLNFFRIFKDKHKKNQNFFNDYKITLITNSVLLVIIGYLLSIILRKPGKFVCA